MATDAQKTAKLSQDSLALEVLLRVEITVTFSDHKKYRSSKWVRSENQAA